MPEEIRIKVDLQFDGLQENNETGRYGFAVIRPLPASCVKSLYDFASIEIPVSQIQNLKEYRDGVYHFTQTSMKGDAVWWLETEAQSYVEHHLDELTDISALSLESLVAIREEYDENDWWSGLSDEQLPDGMDHLFEILDRLDELIDSRGGSDIRAKMRQTARGSGRSGFIYLLRSASGHWKIGFSSNPKDRIKTFSIRLPFEVSYEHLIPTSHMIDAEMALHSQFAPKRIDGEWFALDDADVAYIKSIKSLDLDRT